MAPKLIDLRNLQPSPDFKQTDQSAIA